MDIECPSCRYSISSEHRVESQLTTSGHVGEDSKIIFTCPNCGESLCSEDPTEQTISQQSGQAAETKQRFSHFQLIRVLGRGGFGTVWLAEDLSLDRKVALKLPLRRFGDNSSFIREAKTVAKLRHENIVTVYEVGVSDGQAYIVSEYIPGMTLRSLLEIELLDEQRAIDLLRQIGSGLHHAHEHKIVHRDMKPANVLVDDSGRPLVTDFGLALKEDVEESGSSKGKVVGTIVYMAPEQAAENHERIDRRADIYAVGLMMYEMLTGERPFRGNAQAQLHQKAHDDPTPLRKLRPSIPLDLETICLKCLQRLPNRRYDTAKDFVAELNRYRDGQPILARPVSKAEYAYRWCQRNQAVASLLTMFVMTLTIGLISTTYFWLRAREETSLARRSLYASRMSLASDLFHKGDIESTDRTLNQFVAKEHRSFLGFEWHYLRNRIERYGKTVYHGTLSRDVAVNRDGTWFASLSDKSDISVWDAKTGNRLRQIPVSIGRWQCLAISPKNNQMAAGSKDGTVHVWRDIQNESVLPTVLKHGPSVVQLKFSGNGKRLFSAAYRGAIRIWDTETFKLLYQVPTGLEGMLDFDVSHDGRTLAVIGEAAEGVIRVWDVDVKATQCLVRIEATPTSIGLTKDGSRFVTGSPGGVITTYDSKDGKEIGKKQTPYGRIGEIVFLGNGNIIAYNTNLNITILFDIERQTVQRYLNTHEGGDSHIAVSADGKTFGIGSKNGAVTTIELDNQQFRNIMQGKTHVRQTELLGGKRVVVAFGDGSVDRIDFSDGSIQNLQDPSGIDDAKIGVATKHSIVAVASTQHGLRFYDLKNQCWIGTAIGQHEKATSILFNPLDSAFYVAWRNGPLIQYKVRRKGDDVIVKEGSRKHDQIDGVIRDIAIAPSENLLAVAIDTKEVRFFDTEKWRWQSRLIELTSRPIAIDYVGKDLIIGTRDGFLMRYDVNSNTPLWRTKAQNGHLNDVEVIPNSDTVASVGRDNVLIIRDAITGDKRAALYRHHRQIFSLAASKDGKTLVTGGLEGYVCLWDGNPQSIPNN